MLGTDNETVLKRAAGPQIAPVYGTDFRSTPVFFMQDDHDYFDNDEATDEIITFPPSYFMLQLARATQSMFYPEFLPDVGRPRGLPWSSAADRSDGLSETFGTIRYGRLAEVLLYDIRRTLTLAGPSAVYVDLEAERWLTSRMAATEVTHVVHAPSNPPGWTAGKWGEWYPDILGRDVRAAEALHEWAGRYRGAGNKIDLCPVAGAVRLVTTADHERPKKAPLPPPHLSKHSRYSHQCTSFFRPRGTARACPPMSEFSDRSPTKHPSTPSRIPIPNPHPESMTDEQQRLPHPGSPIDNVRGACLCTDS